MAANCTLIRCVLFWMSSHQADYHAQQQNWVLCFPPARDRNGGWGQSGRFETALRSRTAICIAALGAGSIASSCALAAAGVGCRATPPAEPWAVPRGHRMAWASEGGHSSTTEMNEGPQQTAGPWPSARPRCWRWLLAPPCSSCLGSPPCSLMLARSVSLCGTSSCCSLSASLVSVPLSRLRLSFMHA